MAQRSTERSAPLYFDDVLYLLSPSTGLVSSGDGLVDYSLRLVAAGEGASLALFQVLKTQTDSTATSSKEGITYGAEVLLMHLYSGLYLSMDPLGSSKVQLMPVSEKSRVRILPVSAGQDSIGDLVFSYSPFMLLFQYRQTHLGLSLDLNQRLDMSPTPDQWKLQLAYEPAVYPKVTPFSFIHLQHSGFPAFLSLSSQGLSSLPDNHAISTYWQLEPSEKSGLYRLLNLRTQTYLSSNQNSSISIVTSSNDTKELAYHASCLLVSLETVLGVSQEKVTAATAERLLRATEAESTLRYEFGSDRSYFQVLPADVETGHLLNRLCRIAANIRKTENSDVLEGVCTQGLAWVQGNMHKIAEFIGESGLLEALIDAYVRIVGVRIRRNEGNALGSIVSLACQVLVNTITQENSSNRYLLPYFPHVFWLRQQLEAYHPDPQLNFDVICRLLLDKDVVISQYPVPQTSLSPCLDAGSSLHWVQQLSPIATANISYQSLVLRMLNHMIYHQGRYDREQAAAIGAQLRAVAVPRIETIGGEICMLFPAESLEEFKRLNAKLKDVANSFESGKVQISFLRLAGKEEVYWRYMTQCVKLNGLLQPVSYGCDFAILISLAKDQQRVHIRILRTCLHVLSIVLFPRWRRVPLYEALAGSGLSTTPLSRLSDIRALLISHLSSESLAEAAELEHTNSLLYLEEAVKCATLLLRSYVLDSEFVQGVMGLLSALIAGFGVEIEDETCKSSWIYREVRECLRVGFTSKRRLALQRLLSTTVYLLHTLIQTCELQLIWSALDLRSRKASHHFLPDLLIAQSFGLSTAPSAPLTTNSPLLPKASLPATGPSLITLLQRLVFTQPALLGPEKVKILRICDQISYLTESLTKVLNSIFRANDREMQSLMDFISTKAQSIDNLLELYEAPAYDTSCRYLEAVTDLLVDSSIRRVVQRVIPLLHLNKRVSEISLRTQQYTPLEQETITYLAALYYRKASKAGKAPLKDLSSVHLTPICDLLFARREVRQAANEDRERLADWAIAQSNLRAYYLLKDLVLCDFNRLENALLVSNRMIKRLKFAQSTPNSLKSQVEIAISLHILTVCSHSQLVQGQIMHLLSPNLLENTFKHPLALASTFELLLFLAKETENRGVRDYLTIVVEEIATKIENLVRNKATSLLDLGHLYDYIALKQEPAVRRKRKNELSQLEAEPLALSQWKMLLTSDKLVSKGVISVLIKAFSGNMERKGLWKLTDRLQEPLRQLIYCVIEVQKKDMEGSYERLLRKLRGCLELIEQKKGAVMPNQYGFKFTSALSRRRNIRKLPLFPLEIPENGLNFALAEGYLQSLYSILHGSGYSHLYMDAILSTVTAVKAKEAADPLCSCILRIGILWDICECMGSSDLSLCYLGLKVLIALLKPASVLQRNGFKEYLESKKLHGGLIGKYSELISSLCAQAGEYGLKCEAALEQGQDPANVPVADSFYERLEIGLEYLRLVQLTCDLCNHPFQTFYSQWPYLGTESGVWTLAKGLSDLRQSIRLFLNLRGKEADQIGTFETETLHVTFALGEEICRLVAGLLDGLQELATGPCAINQSLISRNSQLLLALNQLLQVTVEPDQLLYEKTVDLLLALAEGEAEDAVIDRLVEVLNLGLCLRQIEAFFTAEKTGKSSVRSEPFTKLFIFLLTLRQRRPTHPVLAQLPASPSYAHYLSKVGYVEITMNSLVQGLYFPIPARVQHMTLRTRASVIWDIDRSTQMNQINEFMQMIQIWNFEMKHQANIRKVRCLKILTAQWQSAGWLGLALIVALNVALVWQVERAEQLIDGKELPNREVYTVLGALQTVMGIIQYVCYYIEYYPNLISEQEISRKEILKGLVLEQPLALEIAHNETIFTPKSSVFSALFCRWDSLRFLSYLLCSLFAIYYPFCYCLLLLDIIRKNSGIEVVLQSITINKGRLLLTFCLGLLIVYIFSIFGFVFLKEDLNGLNGIVCTDLLHCFTSLFGVGVKSQGEMLAATSPSNDLYWWSLLFDLTFFILVIVILLNITFGIILNSFSQLRDEKKEKLNDIYSRCYICGHHRSEINLRGGGWRWHLVGEHSPFAYIAFLIYVMDKPEDLCSGLEQYVKVMYLAGNYSFMPTTSKQLQEAH